MLAGKYFHQIDEKGRIRIPAKFKEELGNVKRVFVTRGPMKSLFVFTEETAEEIMKSMRNDKLSTSEFSAVRRMFVSSGGVIEDDQQGRTLLPQDLIAYAQIKKNIVTVGNLDRLEIWSQENWDKLQAEYAEQDFDEALKKVADYL